MKEIRQLVRKNLLYNKRHYFKTLFHLLFPPIFIYFTCVIFRNLGRTSQIETKYLDRTNSYDYTNWEFGSSFFGRDIAIVTTNKVMAEELKELLMKRSNGVCGDYDECSTPIFDTEKMLDDYLNSDAYYKYSRYVSTAIIVEESTNSFYFHIKTNVKEPYTIDYSLDKFNIIPITDYYPQTFLQSLHHLLGYYKLQKIMKSNPIINDRKLVINTIPLKSPPVLNSNVDTEALLTFVLTFCASIAFMPTTIKLSLYLISESETRQKQLLRRQGVSLIVYNISWYIYIIIENIVPIAALSVIMKFYYFPYIDPFFIFLCYTIFAIDIISITLFTSQFFSRQKSGQVAFKILYVGATFFSTLVSRTDSRLIYKIIFSFIPFVPFNSALLTLIESRHFTTGIDKAIFFTFNNGNSYGMCLLTMLLNSFIFFGLSLLAAYYYELNIGFIESLCWTPKKRKVGSEKSNEEALISEPIEVGSLLSQRDNKETLKIIDLCVSRVTNDVEFKIENFNLELFKNEIYILVGENGSGKSTLIKAMSQEIYSESGKVIIDDMDILKDRSYLYKIMGLNCQENILFEHMTVFEHILMIDKLKSDSAMKRQEINELIDILGITTFKDTLVKELSEGVKRKLCVALTMVGNSKLVLLDEPTSGVDVFSRRELWNFLLKYKKDRIIIISTHSLEEADYLADRIGIMRDGKLICSASPTYLKEVYSNGLNLKFVFTENTPKKYKLAFIKKIMEEPYANFITIKSLNKDSVTINYNGMPEDFNFRQVFESYDKLKSDYRIQEYTIFTTSLEDVISQVYLMKDEEIRKSVLEGCSFVRTSLNINHNNTLDFTNENDTVHQFPIVDSKLTKKRSFFESLRKNLKKNFLVLSRSKSLLFFELASSLFPLLFFVLSVNKYSGIEIKIDPLELVKRTNEIPFNQYFTKGDDKDYLIDNPKSFFLNINNKFTPVLNGSFLCSINNITYFDDVVFESFKLSTKSAIYVTNSNYKNFEVTAWYSANALDFSISLQELIYRSFVANDYGISSGKATIFKSYSNLSYGSKYKATTAFLNQLFANFLISLGILIYVGFNLYLPVNERVHKLKHLQYLKGGSKSAYWIANFIIDIVRQILFLGLALSLFLVLFDIQVVYEYYLLILVFKVTVTLTGYIFSYFIDNEENAQNLYILINYALLVIAIILNLALFPEQIFSTTNWIITFTVISPLSEFLLASLRLATNALTDATGDHNIIVMNSVIVMSLHLLIYLLILTTIELASYSRRIEKIFRFLSKLFELVKPFSREKENMYTSQEEIRVENEEDYSLILNNINKVYTSRCNNKVVAVDHLNLALETNEKIAFIGPNGCGKSTIIKSIAYEHYLNTGTMQVFGKNFHSKFSTIRLMIGYCPQVNTLFDSLTVKENIEFFLDDKNNQEKVEDLLTIFSLTTYENRLTINLSDGTRRKLNLCIALINQKKLLVLDEPFTGVDPMSRKKIWNKILQLNEQKLTHNLLISTHSLEEAATLCDTIAWVHKGSFLIKGSSEKIKSKYHEGYEITFRVNYSFPQEKMVDKKKLSYIKIENFIEKIKRNSEMTVKEKKILKFALFEIFNDSAPVLDHIKLVNVSPHQIKVHINFSDASKIEFLIHILHISVSISYYKLIE